MAMIVKQDMFAAGEVRLDIDYGKQHVTVVFTPIELRDDAEPARDRATALLREFVETVSRNLADPKGITWRGI